MAGSMLSEIVQSHESEQWGMVLVGEGFGHSDGKAGRCARMEGLRDCIGSGGYRSRNRDGAGASSSVISLRIRLGL